MIKMYSIENSRDWDEGVHMLLFVKVHVHESVQESLGFSPFELVLGHTVQGPLLILKEKWLDEGPEKIIVLKYVATFKYRLFRAGQMAKRRGPDYQVPGIGVQGHFLVLPGGPRQRAALWPSISFL